MRLTEPFASIESTDMLDIENLRLALASRLGQVLTPEVASMIEVQARTIPDKSHDPAVFGTAKYGGLLFQAERIRDIVAEIHPLHEAHYAETEAYRAGIKMDPDYDEFIAAEKGGELIQFTARDVETGKLVGNIRMYVYKSMHTKTLVATEDTFYLLPECRKGLAAVRFWQFMERAVRQLGVREIETDSKVTNKAHRLSEYMGYQHVANSYIKVFSE
jgi:hypothetical protein